MDRWSRTAPTARSWATGDLRLDRALSQAPRAGRPPWERRTSGRNQGAVLRSAGRRGPRPRRTCQPADSGVPRHRPVRPVRAAPPSCRTTALGPRPDRGSNRPRCWPPCRGSSRPRPWHPVVRSTTSETGARGRRRLIHGRMIRTGITRNVTLDDSGRLPGRTRPEVVEVAGRRTAGLNECTCVRH